MPAACVRASSSITAGNCSSSACRVRRGGGMSLNLWWRRNRAHHGRRRCQRRARQFDRRALHQKLPGIEHAITPGEGIVAAEQIPRPAACPAGRHHRRGLCGPTRRSPGRVRRPMFEFLFGIDTQLRREGRPPSSWCSPVPSTEPGATSGSASHRSGTFWLGNGAPGHHAPTWSSDVAPAEAGQARVTARREVCGRPHPLHARRDGQRTVLTRPTCRAPWRPAAGRRNTAAWSGSSACNVVVGTTRAASPAPTGCPSQPTWPDLAGAQAAAASLLAEGGMGGHLRHASRWSWFASSTAAWTQAPWSGAPPRVNVVAAPGHAPGPSALNGTICAPIADPGLAGLLRGACRAMLRACRRAAVCGPFPTKGQPPMRIAPWTLALAAASVFATAATAQTTKLRQLWEHSGTMKSQSGQMGAAMRYRNPWPACRPSSANRWNK